MKNLVLLTAFSFVTFFSFAQNSLLEGASLLFKNAKSKLSVTQKNEIYISLGLTLTKDKKRFVAMDDKTEAFPFDYVDVFPVDLNKDGKEEICVQLSNAAVYGMSGATTELFVLDANGKYKVNKFDGLLPQVLTTKNLGYPDLILGVPGANLPVWRWNGKTYRYYKSVSDSQAQQLQTTDLEAVSNTYVASF